MTKYEYTAVVARFHLDVLNEQGAQGREYVTRMDGPDGGSFMVFKRRIEEVDTRTQQAKAPTKRVGTIKAIPAKTDDEIVIE